METLELSLMVGFFKHLLSQEASLTAEEMRLEAAAYEAEANRMHQLYVEEVKHRHQSEREEANRRHQLDLEEERRRHELDLNALAKEARLKEEWLRHVYQNQQVRGGLITEPGTWKSQLFPTSQSGPFILFDTLTAAGANQPKLPFDPVQFLAEQFKIQSQPYGHLVKTLTLHEGFTSDSHARQFLRQEFAEDSVALVYATFSGNRLSFHALYNGLTADQLMISKEEHRAAVVSGRIHYALLGRFPFSFFHELAAHRESQMPPDQKVFEDAEFIFDLVVNTSLQALIDQFIACQPASPHVPRALSLFRQKSERLKELGFWDDVLAEKLELHDLKIESLRAQARALMP